MKALSILFGMFFALVALKSLPAKPARTFENDAIANCLRQAGFRRINLTLVRDHLVLPAKINEQSATMVVATGAPISALDRRSLRRFRLNEVQTTWPVSGAFGRSAESYGMLDLKTLDVANAVFRKVRVATLDLHLHTGDGPPQFDGILGLAELRRVGGVVDCGHRILYFNPKGSNKETSRKLSALLAQEGFARVPLGVDSLRHLAFDCTINGYRSSMMVETAAYTSFIVSRIAAKAGVRASANTTEAIGVGNRKASLHVGQVNEFVTGNFRILNTHWGVIDSEFNCLGIDQLSAHYAIIDTGALALYLKHQSSP